MERSRVVPWVLVGLLGVLAVVVHYGWGPGSPSSAWDTVVSRISGDDVLQGQRIAEDLHERLNDERAERGLPALPWDDDLAKIAEDWARQARAAGGSTHLQDEIRHPPGYRGSSRHILQHYRGSHDAHLAWMEADEHRAALLGTEFSAVGIGAVCRDGLVWAAQILGISDEEETHAGAPGDAPPLEPIVRTEPGLHC